MKVIKSIAFAWQGLKICFTAETNFRIHVLLGSIAVLLGFILNVSKAEWGFIIFFIAFVIAMEMMNTAIEQLCNVVRKETHLAIKNIKDIAAGAVMAAAAGSFITGLIIFLPKIIMFIKSV